MPSKTDIANFALTKIEQPRIDSIESNADKPSRECAFHFDQCVKEVGGATPFNCITKFSELTESGTPPYKWGYSYALPSNFLRVNRFNNLDIHEQWSDYYQIAGKYLYTDMDTAAIEYNEFTDNTGMFDALLVDAIACNLAMKLAPSLLGAGGDIAGLKQLYDLAIGKAAANNHHQGKTINTINDVLQGSRLIGARRSSTNG